MNRSESLVTDAAQISWLRELVSHGEGLHLEFKRRASVPEKVVRELIAFANTGGGKLLVGVNDDGALSGLKYPEEESLMIRKALKKHCKPFLYFKETVIALSGKKFVLEYDVPLSRRRPHSYRINPRESETYIRVRDMSMKASREMTEIIRTEKLKKNIQFTYGVHESALIRYLDKNENISLNQFRKLTGLPDAAASRKLITLVLADVIRITPTEKEDLYSRK